MTDEGKQWITRKALFIRWECEMPTHYLGSNTGDGSVALFR